MPDGSIEFSLEDLRKPLADDPPRSDLAPSELIDIGYWQFGYEPAHKVKPPAKRLAFHLVSDRPEIDEAVEALYIALADAQAFEHANIRKLIGHLRMIVLNVIRMREIKPSFGISYSRRTNEYGNRYTPGYGYRSVTHCVDALTERGFVEHIDGVKSKYGYGFRSCFFATPKLCALLDESRIIGSFVEDSATPPESIVLKNANHDAIPYSDTDQIREMRALVQRYNQYLSNADINLPQEHADQVDLLDRKVHRVFNDSSFELGGRFYGAWWIGAPKAVRPHILINENPTVELDYRATIIHQLYSEETINYHHRYNDDDPYELIGFENVPRDFRKEAFQRILNTRSKAQAKKSITDNIPGDCPDFDVAALIDAYERKHNAISHHFFTRCAVRLQFKDSRICEAIIRACLDRNIVVLTVHDSFIVEGHHADFLEALMIHVWQELGQASVPEISWKPDIRRAA